MHSAFVRKVFLSGLVVRIGAPQIAAAQAPQPRTAELVRTIGGDASADPARDGFGTIGAITISPNGQLAVFDPAECHVKLLAADGRFLRSFGRRGQGPGEFSCRNIRLSSTDSLIEVIDRSQGMRTVFARNGRLLSSTSYSAGFNTPLRHNFHIRLQNTWSRVSGLPTSFILLVRDSTRVDTIARWRSNSEVVVTLADGWRFAAPSGAGVGRGFAVWGDSIVALVDGMNTTVTFHRVTPTGLQQARTVRIPVTTEKLSPSEREGLLANVRNSRAVRSDVAARGSPVATISEIPDTWSPVWMARFSEDGVLWVGLENRAQRRTDWLVVPNSGSAFAVRFPENVSLATVRGNIAIGRTLTRHDIPAIAIYRIPDGR